MSEENLRNERLKELVRVLPESPGVYQYFNAEGKIIYVGKAKNLKKRVSSYFSKHHDNRKTAILVRKIEDIQHVVVETEEDALLLENNLIKKYQPRYNVLLKDDKSYPWICIKNEPFPRVFSTRRVVRDGSLYFGPYTSVGMVRTILDVIKQLYAIRTCGYNLAQDNIAKGNYKVCLEYHLGNCKGPCEGLQEEGEYNEMIDQIKNILKGNLNSVTSHLQSVMDEYASLYEFEKAAEIKSKFDILEKYRSKSTIVGSSITDLDVFSFDEDEKFGYVNFLKVVDGAIIQSHTIEMRKRLDESKEELLALGIVEIRQKVFSNAREIVVPFFPDTGFGQINFTVPQRGDKRKLLELSQKNARFYKLEKRKQQSLRNPQNKVDRIMETMKIDLRLKEVPVHIECFDNSNIQGNYPVASCVVFRNGKPAKRDYRHFNIKTVEGPNDFASMEEIIFRRYRRLLDEEKDLPQLIVIDGGKGQLGAALNALEKLGLRGKISIIGIAKRLEEIFFPGDSIPIYLDKNSETLKIIQRLRDEAHRFGITFHRNKRSAGFIKSELDSIPGIGPKTVEALLKEFKSLEQIKSRSIEKIAGIIGRSKAEKIISFFNSNSSKSTNK
ncbi:excinuclease ABC subunit UvrC [Prolixibacter sp. SD074]|jgi:excinuclease ABC subunit C|uniref:excinuclease ABC subunit UvrC n=1 Tax=Prolixibacter sp. SD074 TaxID=2652391 RepID=UPI001273B8BA|nr:excinuclease ABC subunit UvrC [Prolixibacter sp. SD074]GET30451.1 UvrABC system protein C [Prolixibacter sp. SD074]